MTGVASFKMTLSRFTDRPIFASLDRTKIRFFNRSGGAIRLTAKRSLKKAAQVKDSELTPVERARFRERMASWKAGKLRTKPRRREKTAALGQPPLLHMKPKSPLRELLFYAVDNRQESTVVGPAQFKNGNLSRLELAHPFMAPAFKKIEPNFPQYLGAARG